MTFCDLGIKAVNIVIGKECNQVIARNVQLIGARLVRNLSVRLQPYRMAGNRTLSALTRFAASAKAATSERSALQEHFNAA